MPKLRDKNRKIVFWKPVLWKNFDSTREGLRNSYGREKAKFKHNNLYCYNYIFYHNF